MALAAIEGTVVGTVMPTIVNDLGGLERYNWVFSVYMVSAAVTMPIWSKLSDLHGPRRYFFAGVALFVSGSALAGLSPTIEQLIAVRVVQGIGAGALFTLPMTILGHHAAPERRGHVLGIAAATWGIAALLGPPIGALVTATLGWRWVFFLNVPFGIVALYLVLHYFEDPEVRRGHRLDFAGAVLIMGAAFALMIGAQAFREQAMLLGLGAGAWAGLFLLLLPLAVWVERRADEPIVPLRLFRTPVYRVGNGAAFLMAFNTFAALVYIPMMTTLGDPTNVARAGLSLVPTSIGWTMGAFIAGRLVAGVGGRVLGVVGALLSTTGFLFATQLGPDTSLPQIVATTFPIGLGMGMTSPGILVTLQNHLGAGQMGVVTGGVAFYRHLGGTLGVTVLGLFVPALGGAARISSGVQHAFMAAAVLGLGAALLLSRLPGSIFPELAELPVPAVAELDGVRVGAAFESAE